ncbi:propionyl-CoA--succinate CoA transferase [Oxalobacter vibrioformis]|uniref:Propionyl-CoA--succinate CoA transferase n=1 Tax=Oxalobacter vibrioformis TaxID=933080 RepID=A0A9E9P3G1_9BURK|nr:acetyl-CoA hydrolase/transferase C-terminal domain-containing protein [Oxalobacter vibrioformis]WAW10185.1 propionyl-CoA--succinate CoA transferase [Oxalobacter vibrioformis]
MDQEKVKKRIRYPGLDSKIMSAAQAAEFIKDGMVVGMSGFTRAGDPKQIPFEFAKIAEGGKRKIYLMTGASLGADVDGAMARADAISKRTPFMSDRDMRAAINQGRIPYYDLNLGDLAPMIRRKQLPDPDIAVVEATAITEDGIVIPTSSCGSTDVFLEKGKQILLEINMAVPDGFEGVHDCYIPQTRNMPAPAAIPIMDVMDRAGSIGYKIDPSKIVGIVLTNQLDSASENVLADPAQDAMATNLRNFFLSEIKAGRMTESLFPLQAGVGSVANAGLWGLLEGPFQGLTMWSEVLQDSTWDLLDSGRMTFATGTSITVSPKKTEEVYGNWDRYKDKVCIRPIYITNSAEIIKRINLIAVNTAMDVDIYGNVNSTNIAGSNMMNGIGGSGDFAVNAHTTIFLTRAASPDGRLSRVLPMVPHVDHNEHNVDIIITDLGIADLRGLSPRERAAKIIAISSPDYKPALEEYFRLACERGGHTPHILEKAFEFFENQRKTGSMKG